MSTVNTSGPSSVAAPRSSKRVQTVVAGVVILILCTLVGLSFSSQMAAARLTKESAARSELLSDQLALSLQANSELVTKLAIASSRASERNQPIPGAVSPFAIYEVAHQFSAATQGKLGAEDALAFMHGFRLTEAAAYKEQARAAPIFATDTLQAYFTEVFKERVEVDTDTTVQGLDYTSRMNGKPFRIVTGISLMRLPESKLVQLVAWGAFCSAEKDTGVFDDFAIHLEGIGCAAIPAKHAAFRAGLAAAISDSLIGGKIAPVSVTDLLWKYRESDEYQGHKP